MTRDEALERGAPASSCRVQLHQATGTNGIRWFRALRNRRLTWALELYAAPWGIATREVDLRLADACECDWVPGAVDPDPATLPEHPGLPGYVAWQQASEDAIAETSRICREEWAARGGRPLHDHRVQDDEEYRDSLMGRGGG